MTFLEIAKIVSAEFYKRIEKTIVGGLPTLYDNQIENVSFEKPQSKWCRLTVKLIDAPQVTMGVPKTYRISGIAIAQIFTPLGEGDAEGLRIADFIRAAFVGAVYDHVHFTNPYPSFEGNSGAFWQINLICPFYADDLRT